MREGDSGFAWRRLSWSFEEKKTISLMLPLRGIVDLT